MLTVTLNRAKFDNQRTKLQALLGRRLKDMKAEVHRQTYATAAEICHSLLVNTMPSPSSGIGKAIAHIVHDARNGLLTPGQAYEILLKESSRRTAAAFYAAHKKGDIAKAITFLRKSGSTISHFEIGNPEKLDPLKINYPKNRILSTFEIDAYLKKTIKRLGKTASGWAACLERLGQDGNTIKWKGTAIHGSDGGKINIVHDKHQVTIWLANTRPLARKLINPSQVRRIVQQHQEKLKTTLQQKF